MVSGITNFCRGSWQSNLRQPPKRAVLIRGDFTDSVFSAADLSGADIRSADFTGSFWPSDAMPNLRGAIYDHMTRWPKGVDADLAERLGAIDVKKLPPEVSRKLVQITYGVISSSSQTKAQ